MLQEAVSTIWRSAKFRQLALYATCGGFGVSVDLTCYSLLVFSGMGYQLANAIGYAAGTLVSFFLNRHFTFRTYDRTVRRLALFFGAAGIGYLISSAMLWVFVGLMDIHPIPAKVMTLAVVVAVQFLINRAITFRASQDDAITND